MSLARGFRQGEFETRTARAQRLMADRGLDGLLFCTEPEIRYFTGFLTPFWHSPTRPWFVIVPRAGKPVAVIPEIGVPLMAETWIDDIVSWPAPRPHDDGISLLEETLKRIGAGRGRIGLPMGSETTLRMPLKDYMVLRERLSGAEIIDATDVISTLRMVKSEAEIAKITEICRIVSDGFEAVPGAVRVGDNLSDVFSAFRIDLIGRGADDVPYLIGAAAPGGYDNIIAPPREIPLAVGDLLMMDTGAMRDGYFADFDRNFAIASATRATDKAYTTLVAATEAGLQAARPGVTCAELYAVIARVISAAGYGAGNVGRFGHGLGMQLTEWPSISPRDHTKLEPGMVLALEPGLTISAGRGMVHEENIVIRADGAELISRRAPSKLQVVPG